MGKRPSKCAPTLTGFKDSSANLGQEVPDDALRKRIWGTKQITTGAVVKAPPELSVMETLLARDDEQSLR
jgi:hypothetical protein